MKHEEILNKILEINQKFMKTDKENTSELYFEMLHACLIEIVSVFTEDQFNELAKPFRITLKKLENNLLDCCSMTYCENYQEYIKEHGLFKKKQEKCVEDEINLLSDFGEEDDEENCYNEEDDRYEPKWIDNPSYDSNLIL